MVSWSLRQTVLPVAAVLVAVASPARAAGTCAGTIETSVIHPLPQPMVVMGATSIANSPNPELTRRFVSGLQQAGVRVSDDDGNVTLNIAVSVAAPPTDSKIVSGQYEGFSWVSGEPLAAGQTVPGLRSTSLSMSAVLSDNVAVTQSWIATIDCRVQTDDPGSLAEDLGLVIGRAFGNNIDRRRL